MTGAFFRSKGAANTMAESFLQRAQIASAFVPVDMSSGANAGDWVQLGKVYDRCLAVLFKGAGTAGDDPVFKLQQATDNAGTGAKDIDFTAVYSKVGTLTASGQAEFTRNTQSAATSYTDAASAEAEAIIAVEIRAEELDLANGFEWIQLSVADVGTNAQLGCGFYVLFEARYEQEPMPGATQ